MAHQFQKFAQEGDALIHELAQYLNCKDNPAKAGRILRTALHTLRSHIPPQESLQFIAQLPFFLKAIYVDGWKMRTQPNKVHHIPDFVKELQTIGGPTGAADFPDQETAIFHFNTVFLVLRKYVSFGELEDLKANLPKHLKSILSYDILARH